MNLSRWQYGTLLFIATHIVTLDVARTLHAQTLASLLRRGFITCGSRSTLFLTSAGDNALSQYRHAKPREREHEMDLTQTVSRLLKVTRVVQMSRRVA